MGEVEDEIHFFFICSKLCVDREILLNSIADICKNFVNVTNEQKFVWLMSCENAKILNFLADIIIKYDTI